MLGVFLVGVCVGASILYLATPKPEPPEPEKTEAHWFLLHRKSNKEFLYKGVPGDKTESVLVKSFEVKTGTQKERPTPLPHLLGRHYWIVTKKLDTRGEFETAPFFLELNVPVSEFEPYGPSPYTECNGQCNWVIPGAFGLHGTGGDPYKLSPDDPGSSGCIRHSDDDISYLYYTLEPEKEEIRYYIKDI